MKIRDFMLICLFFCITSINEIAWFTFTYPDEIPLIGIASVTQFVLSTIALLILIHQEK